MAEVEEDRLSWLSLKDFEEREIKIDPNWSGLEALAAVACLAYEKLEEEKKDKEEKERKSVERNGYWSKLVACNGYERGSSSRSCDDRRAWQPRVSVGNEREKSPEKSVRNSVPDVHSKKGKEFVADSDIPGSSPGSTDKRSCLTRVSGRREREKAQKKPVTNSVSDMYSKKKQGFKIATRDKLLGDAMKSRVMAWGDDYDEEWIAKCTKEKQKLKRNSNEEKDSKSNKKVRGRYVAPKVTPDLPKELKEKIENLNGSKINLVIQKYLYSSDLSDHQSRLLMPWKQIPSIEKSLNDDERIYLDDEKEQMSVNFIGPSLQKCKMTLKKRSMRKEKGESSLSYVLITEWKQFKIDNNLQIADIIQLWSFRTPPDELWLALVVVGKGGKIYQEKNQNNKGNFDGANSSQGNGSGNSPGSEGMGSNTT